MLTHASMHLLTHAMPSKASVSKQIFKDFKPFLTFFSAAIRSNIPGVFLNFNVLAEF